jgi:hypothetical protein
MKQESVVDLLFNAIQKVDKMDWDLVYISAKKIEKEQMIDFAKQWEARQNDGNLDTIEMLYNETYNK